MKNSRYNFFFPYEEDDSKLIAYNSFSNALALMEKTRYEELQRFIEHGENIADESFVQKLKRGYFLIDEDCNELDMLRFRMLKGRYNTDSLGLTIAPTADCNFRCLYCYEKDVIKPDYMTQETESAILKLVKSRIKTISNLSITWYGGEPLMNMESIERLSRGFISLCDEHGVRYDAGMVTNGYLLTDENARLINELKITFLQITLDGSEDIHNQRRPLSDGSGTFNTIIDNLVRLKNVLPGVALRVNIDKNNANAGKEIVDFLRKKELPDKFKPYLGKITAENNEYDKSSCFDCCGFSQEELSFYNEFHDKKTFMHRYPRVVSNFCGADKLNSYVIAADGKLYKCWNDIGNSEGCVGSLVDAMDVRQQAHLDYMLFDPTTDNECSQCNLLPICMGGCPYMKRIENDKCSIYKFALEGFLAVITSKISLIKKEA